MRAPAILGKSHSASHPAADRTAFNHRPLPAIALCVAVALTLAVPARANLLGSTLSWQYYAYGGPYIYTGGQTGGTFVDNGGIGGTFVGGTTSLYFNIIADDTSITFDYSIVTGPTPRSWTSSPLSLAPTIYNGIAINMVSGPAFSSVTIDPASNMVGFDASRFSFTGTQIQVDWQNLSFTPSTIVKLDIQTVPEPSMFALASLAAAALMLRRYPRARAGDRPQRQAN